MTTFTGSFETIQPRLLRMAHGDWLAVTEAGSPLRIGVCGATPEVAREKFAQELAIWVRMLGDEADMESVIGASSAT